LNEALALGKNCKRDLAEIWNQQGIEETMGNRLVSLAHRVNQSSDWIRERQDDFGTGEEAEMLGVCA